MNDFTGLADPGKDAIEQALKLLCPKGRIHLCAITPDGKTAKRGTFDSPAKAATAAAKLEATGKYNLYWLPNAIADDAPLSNFAGGGIDERKVKRRQYLWLDPDPAAAYGEPGPDGQRKKLHRPASDEEHRAVEVYVDKLCEILGRYGIKPILIDTGNGYQLFIRCDLPRDASTKKLAQAFQDALARNVDEPGVDLDDCAVKAAQLARLPGTTNRKGAATEERPYRPAWIISPGDGKVVSRETLEKIVADLAPEAAALHEPPGDLDDGQALDRVTAVADLDRWLTEHGVECRKVEPDADDDGDIIAKWLLPVCPFCGERDRPAVMLRDPGGWCFHCFHNRCTKKGWHDFRAAIEKSEREYKPFPVDALPEPLRSFVAEYARSFGNDPAFVALPALACLSRACGNNRMVEVKSDWQDYGIIWAAVISGVGTIKSPTYKAAIRWLKDKQRQALEVHRANAEDDRRAKLEYEADLAAWRKKRQGAPPTEPTYHHCERYFVGDATREAVLNILAKQYHGVVVTRDELNAWFASFDQYRGGRGGDQEFWQQAHTGGHDAKDRVSGDDKFVFLDRVCVSVYGGIQPSTLRRAFAGSLTEGGIAARFLLAMPPATPAIYTDATADPAIVSAFHKALDAILAIDDVSSIEEFAAADRPREPRMMRFTPEAHAAFVVYNNATARDAIAIGGHVGESYNKMRGYAARIAMLFQLLEWAAGRGSKDAIELPATRAAVTLCEWFKNEHRRVYAMLSGREDEPDYRLVELIKKRGGSMSASEVVRYAAWIKTNGDAERELMKLQTAGLGKFQLVKTKTKPAYRFCLADYGDLSIYSPENRDSRESVDEADDAA